MSQLTPTEILAATTSAVTAVKSHPIWMEMLPTTIFATGLAGSESVAILFSTDGGVTFEPLAQDGADLVLTATKNTLAINSPMLLGVTKSATIASSGVFIQPANTAPRSPA